MGKVLLFNTAKYFKNIAIWSRWSGESTNTIIGANSYNLYKSKSIFFNIRVKILISSSNVFCAAIEVHPASYK